jgi:hypothetical protein
MTLFDCRDISLVFWTAKKMLNYVVCNLFIWFEQTCLSTIWQGHCMQVKIYVLFYSGFEVIIRMLYFIQVYINMFVKINQYIYASMLFPWVMITKRHIQNDLWSMEWAVVVLSQDYFDGFDDTLNHNSHHTARMNVFGWGRFQ